jgi:GDP-L-fucose synthase
LLDISLLQEAGWMPEIGLRDGIEATVAWYRANISAARM